MSIFSRVAAHAAAPLSDEPRGPAYELIEGSDDPDTIYANDGDEDDTIYGFGGNDRLDGAGGSDTLYGGDQDDRLTGDDGSDPTFAGEDTLYGEAGNDTLRGSFGNDVLFGGDGDDNFHAEDGNDALDGGGGNDVITYYLAASEVGVTLDISGLGANGSGSSVSDGLGGFDSMVSIERTIIGDSRHDDIITGSGVKDTISLGSGHDIVSSGAGDDFVTLRVGDGTIDAGSGDDTVWMQNSGYSDSEDQFASYVLNGGSGNDTLLFHWYTHDEVIILRVDGSGVMTAISDGHTVLQARSIERLDFEGGMGADTVYGAQGDDIIDGQGGVDKLYGGRGDDTYYIQDAGDKAYELSGQGTDLVISSVSYSLDGQYIENLTLFDWHDINATGNSLDNILTGNEGINVLKGRGGDDTYYVQNSDDSIVEGKTDGLDIVYSTVSFVLKSGVYVENLTLLGTADIDGTANGLDNIIRDNAGLNVLAGGKGNDTYYVQNTGDSIVESKTGGVDIVYSTVTFALQAGSYVEKLTLTGTANINAGGNGIDNILTGNAGINVLAGGKGHDTYYVQNTEDTIVEAKSQGTDLVYSSVTFALKAGSYVENLTLTGSADINATGNGIGNILTGNAGVNILTGGKGDDTYHIQNSGDVAIEKKGEGADHVFSSVNYSLKGQYIEYLTLTGSADVYAKGNTLDNRLVGNAGDNRINGMEGQDRLTGGAGADTFIWDATSHSKVSKADQITDLSNADFIDLSRIDANTTVAGTQHFVLVDAFTNTAGQVTLTFDGAYTRLNADTNGDGVSDMLIRIDGDHTDFTNFIFGGG